MVQTEEQDFSLKKISEERTGTVAKPEGFSTRESSLDTDSCMLQVGREQNRTHCRSLEVSDDGALQR
jgi:hypothetical protein